MGLLAMWGSRKHVVTIRKGAAVALTLLLGAPLIGSCGGTSQGGGHDTGGGVGGTGAGTMTGGGQSEGGTSRAGGAHAGGTHAGGTPSGGMPSGGVPSGGMPSGGMPSGGTSTGGHDTAGRAGSGGATETGGEGPAGGAAGNEDGWSCGDQTCTAGQACIHCLIQDQPPQRCVPHPDSDPNGYASAVAACESPPYAREDCDGPEDCPATQYCVANEGIRCQTQASTKHSCCFGCNAITDCTLCHTDQDCPNGETCQPNAVADSKGCRVVR